MFSDDTQNLEFYNQNYEFFKGKNVYIMLEDISRQNIENPLITVFSIAENCARQYWRDHPVEKSEKIAIGLTVASVSTTALYRLPNLARKKN